MYYATTSFSFEAAHYLRDYDGKCAKLHGHSYKVEVTCKGNKLQKNGILVDFSLIKKEGKSIINNLDHVLLNDIMKENPTAENIAVLIFDSLEYSLMNWGENWAEIDSVKVWETEDSFVVYRKD